ncbi:hypothetical protein K503DRAFT_766101 [Rhizopogon vinicolor AM-OR11-026]|uniref:Uncharacterized protein n=1 Tax=Rhizopogon vinicolor AM-OR11-026 TaxID=1314800 RepID=A0A1B7NEC2_9AGAM|nr:hypothetical protein K503DRAFT_766101 [Rhizopogon vinicolor AM-OR11-026]
MTQTNPPVKDPEFMPPRELMRICFELLDLLKAHKKRIRRAPVNSFGYIAKSLFSRPSPCVPAKKVH